MNLFEPSTLKVREAKTRAEEEANDAIALLEQTKAAADEAAKAAVQAETDAEELKSKLTAITEAFNDASREMTKVSARRVMRMMERERRCKRARPTRA